MHGPTARPLPLPYLQIINPLEGFVGAEDQASNKPADMFKSFRTTKDLSKTFHPLGQDLGHPNNRQHGSPLSFSISFFLSSSIHPFFPITFQVVYYTQHVLPHQGHYFPKLVSYQRFVELRPGALLPLCVLLTARFGQCSGISFIDSTKV